MGEVVYRSRVRVVRERGPLRIADMPAGERTSFGVHSEIAAHYGRDPHELEPVSATLDYIVAAAGG